MTDFGGRSGKQIAGPGVERFVRKIRQQQLGGTVGLLREASELPDAAKTRLGQVHLQAA